MIKPIDAVIWEIINNHDVRNILSAPIPTPAAITAHQLFGVVSAQLPIDATGFQIGEPYDGYIEHAPILFLSSNPAYNPTEVSPRYDPANGNMFTPAHTDVTTGAPVLPQNVSFDDVKKFFQERIVTSPANNANDIALRIPLINGTTQAVPYWGSVRGKTESLLPPALTALWDGALNPSQRAREIMKYAVCMEVVPFRSTMAAGVTPAALNYCWNEFTIHLLELSAANLIVLAGVTALNTFCSNLFPGDGAAMATLTGHGTLTCVLGGVPRVVVWGQKVPGGAALMNWDDGYFAPGVLATLNAAVAGSPLVADALANGGRSAILNTRRYP